MDQWAGLLGGPTGWVREGDVPPPAQSAKYRKLKVTLIGITVGTYIEEVVDIWKALKTRAVCIPFVLNFFGL